MHDDVEHSGPEGNPRKRRPHESAPWYKRYARDFYEDTRDLKLDERGAYNDIIDLIYMAEGPIKDDLWAIAHRLHCDVKIWKRIRKTLLANGKLYITRGQLMNKRAREVLHLRDVERRSKGRTPLPSANVGPDLFENPNDINGRLRVNSTESDIESERRSDRSFEPRVIDGGKATRPAQLPRYVSEEALDQVRTIAPGWDRQELLRRFTNWKGSKNAEYIDQAFLGWVRKVTKDKAAS